jgi:hypothetical protein
MEAVAAVKADAVAEAINTAEVIEVMEAIKAIRQWPG